MNFLKNYKLKLFANTLIVLVLMNFIAAYTVNIGYKLITEYSPLIESIMEVKVESTTAHLWLEEVLSGDRNENINEVNNHIDEAIHHATKVLNGRYNHSGDFTPVHNEILEERIKKLLLKLEEFKNITNERYENYAVSGTGSHYDIMYDNFFLSLMDDADNLNSSLKKVILQDVKTYKQTYYFALLLMSSLIIGASILLYRNEKVRAKNVQALLLLNETLEERVKKEVQENSDKSEELIQITEEKNKELSRFIDIFSENVIASNSDLKGNITYASKALCEISGYSEEELIGKPHSILKSPSTPKSVFSDMWKTIKSGQTWNGELKNNKKDAGFYWVRARIMPDYDNDNNIIGYSSVRQNISAEKAKEQFLANMSHELRTPLNAILGFIELIKEDTKEAKTLEYSNIVDASGKSLLGIIDDVLDLAKIESGQITIDKIDFDVKKEIGIIKNLFDAKASEKDIILSLSIDTNMPNFINTDIFRIRQVVSNLFSNAIKFTDANKKIFLDVSYSNGHLNISVRDEGKGIAEDKLSHIFDEFAQEDVSTTRKYGGTGLGLSISKELINLLGGELKVKSELGVGSEFYFSIPATIGKEVSEVIIQKLDFDLKGKKLLVVEDNKTNQLFLKIVLQQLHIEYDIADDGLIALAMFKENKYDAILMDENMPNMGGIEATTKILEYEIENNLPHTLIVAVTANALEGDRDKFLNAGMDEYLTKPIDKIKLYNCLASLFISKN